MNSNSISNMPDDMRDLFKQLQKKGIKRQKWIDEYGNIKNIISTAHKDFRFVAAGSKLFLIGSKDTFHDFLVEYLQQVISKAWIESERIKASDHQLIKWIDSTNAMKVSMERGDKEFFSFIPNNNIAAFMNLAYDLFIIDHNHRLQQDIVKRLKLADQFHGVRYELFVTAICIKAGLKIDYENEKDRRKKHVEFIAFDDSTKQKIGVEAKYKIRENPGNSSTLLDKIKVGNITRLINDATAKNPGLSQFVFIELNLPPEQSQILLSGKDAFQTMIHQTNQIKKAMDGKDLFNAVFFTNHAPFFGRDDERVSKMDFSLMISQNPKYQLFKQQAIIDKITKALLIHEKIPSHFPEVTLT